MRKNVAQGVLVAALNPPVPLCNTFTICLVTGDSRELRNAEYLLKNHH